MRSLLFLPGNNPNMLINGDLLGSDGIIIDLEDAVSPSEKDAARTLVRGAIGFFRYHTPVVVRINSLDTAFWQQDLEELIPMKPDYIMLPKSNGPEDIRTVSAAISAEEERCGLPRGGIGLIALIETAVGVENAYEIAAADPRVRALALGAEDLTADLRCKRTPQSDEILYSRTRLVIAARAAQVDCIDTPFTDANDLEGLEQDARRAKSLGFSGKLLINPRHVQTVNRVFSPSREDIDYAREVVAAIREAQANGRGAVALHGKMIDKPVVDRAEQTLQMAERMGVLA